jgi:hypothetical protein
MGVLDDAIREHLDLKRRHGAAEEELRRQEEEALGPARREVAPAEADDGDGAGTGEAPAEVEAAETAVAEQDELTAADAEAHDPHADEPDLSEALPASAVRSDLSDDEETALYELPPEGDPEGLHEEPLEAGVPREEQLHGEEVHEEALHEEPLREPPPGDHRRDEGAGDTPPRGFEPVEDDELFDDEDELPHADEVSRAGEVAGDDEELGPDETGADGDLLEDTPDFLQETPEHDRLWFEQKPPRDFDFD